PPLAPVVMRLARNLVPNLVYAESGANVRLTMVAGRTIYRDGVFANVDRDAIMAEVASAVTRFEDAADADPAVTSLPIVELTRSGKI
ncbi:MAG TPA: hypothetical protein VKB09_17505, partial [Thermomicrobiales bacterium]|nr:hypothetical protein [Thermomicrobiales bacterium]